jgi:hypothetical protein
VLFTDFFYGLQLDFRRRCLLRQRTGLLTLPEAAAALRMQGLKYI